MSTSQNNERKSAANRSRKSRRPRKKRSLVATLFVRFGQLLGSLVLIGIVTGCFVLCYATIYVQTVIIPEAGLDLSQYAMNESSIICYIDRVTGQPVEMATLSGSEDREWIDYEDIPKYFIDAAVAIEDKDFWTHQGVDWSRTAAAVLYMFTGQDIQGGSTITQQLIKNLTEEDDVTVKRKIGEIFNALEFEKNYEKTDIITWYLNKIYLGQGKYGIVTAAKYYFGKEVSEITLAEAASLIAITNNPSIYSPASTVMIKSRNGEEWRGKEWNKYRQEIILSQMLKYGCIDREQYEEAVAQELVFVFDNGETKTDHVFSWYVEAVIDEVREYLMENFHVSSSLAYDIIYGGGLIIYTPFDPDVQAAVDQVYNDTANLPYISSDGQQMQSAITIVDNSTGYVVALAGAIGEKTGNLMQNIATQRPRQPGSSIKPLSAYSPAVEMGLITPGSIVDDAPILILDKLGMQMSYSDAMATEDPFSLWPRNDDRVYRGLTTVMTGITKSLNTIASRLVSEYVTVDASYQFLKDRYGITTLVDGLVVNGQVKTDKTVASLALGGLTKGVTTFEMAAAYATFPRGGAYTEPTTVLRVETKAGELVWDNEPEAEFVIKESTAYYMNTLLTNAANKGTGTGALVDGQIVAGKTGTTSENYDRWFAGYTPYYTGVVWTGYPINAKITGTTGNPASALWKKVMTIVHEGLEEKPFFEPENTVTANICLDCGQLATDACAADVRTVLVDGSFRVDTFTYFKGDEPTSYCTCHVPVTICTADPILDETGKAVGAWHLATDGCPVEKTVTVYLVNFNRSEIGAMATVKDAVYLSAYYEALGYPSCTVHGKSETQTPDHNENWLENFDWSNFKPSDPTTWPFDPNSPQDSWPFDPYDPTTWPTNQGGGNGGNDEENEDEDGGNGGGESDVTQPDDDPSTSPEDEDFVPANGN